MSVSKIKPKTTKRFTDFNLDDQIIQAINELGWEYPTRVQEGMIPIAMEGKNIIARARTGSGKTAAFVLPLLNQLIQWASSDAEEGPFALIVAPTKELATQIFQLLSQMATRFVFLQLVNLAEKEAANMERVLSTTVDVIVTTPGKIVEVLKQKPDLLQRIKYMVLDEADLLFSYGYKEELLKLKKHLPKKYQAIMTSATLDEDMTEIKQMFASGTVVSLKLKEGQLPNPEQLTQYQVYCNNDEERFTLVLSLLKLKLLVGKTIFFVSSIDRCYKLHLFLQGFKIRSCVLNSQMPANTRSHVINEFNLDKFKYIIASDARDTIGDDDQEIETSAKGKKKKKPRISHDRESGVSRGIDFHFVSNVINFDFPTSTDLYIHRVGRTARGFNRGTALSFVGPHERETFEMVKDDINAQLGEGTIAPYEVRMADFDGFFLRSREVLSAITRTVIRETRLTEIKRELLASKRLDGYFAKNPREKAALANDKRLPGLKLHSTGIADVADYMVPKALRGRYYKSGEDQASSAMSSNRKRRPARSSIFGQGRNKKAKRGTSSSSLTNLKNPRKRRAQLPSINLAGAVAPIEIDEIQQSKSKLPGSASTSVEEPAKHLSRPTSLNNDLSDKRIRLTSSSSTSSTASLLSLVSEGSRHGSSLSLAQADSFCEPSFVEYGQITPSSRIANPITNGEIVGDGEFELITGGSEECKAIEISTRNVYHCTVLKEAEYQNFMAIVERITLSTDKLMEHEQKELRRILMPEGTRVLKSKTPKVWYLMSPDHHGSLHSFYTIENPTASIRNQSPWTEKESKAIFQQVVRLVSYCHQIGIYFGDFRLQKLFYTTSERTSIRILNLRNIYVAPLIQDDTIEKPSKRCCPAYISPEMMKFDKPYSAKSADIWSLGILLYVLLTGRFPFYAQKPQHLARLIRVGQWSFRPTDRISRSARLLVYGLIRQNPAERPSAKEILMCDWLQNQINEPIPTLCLNSMPSRPDISVQVNLPDNGRLNEANPRIPPQLLTVLILSASERNSIYASRSDVRANVEAFASAWQRSTANREEENSSQVVPSSNCDRDLLGISVLRAVVRRNVGSRS